MTLEEAYNFLNFFINKYTGAWYSPSELDEVVDRGQMAYYYDIYGKYGTSIRTKEVLSPFKDTYDFTVGDTPAGVITVPAARNYLDVLDVYITYTLSGRPMTYMDVQFINEDERTIRLRSQLDPVTETSPIVEHKGGGGVFQMWPKVPYTGTVTFLRRPLKPNFVYTTISGRVIVFDSVNSQNLEWREQDINAVLLKTLSILGINLSQEDVLQFAEVKNQGNFMGQNRL